MAKLTVDRYGKELYAVCQAYKHADREIRESLLAIEGVWLKTEHQVEALRKMWNGLDEQVQIHQNNVLALLQERLQIAVVVIDGLDTSSSEEQSLKALFGSKGHVKRLKYAVYAKGKLEKIVIDLDRWHAKFDPSWYLLTRSAAAVMDEPIVSTQASSSKELKIIRELRRAHRINVDNSGSRHSVFLPNGSSIQGRSQILNTSAQIGYAAHKPVIIDTQILTRNVDVQLATKDARDIARILGNVDPNIFSLLTCRGVIKLLSSSDEITGFEFVFEVPAALQEPRSLRSFLLIASHDYPLENRFRLARLLARSVSFLHATQIVHKNITPETVVLLTDLASNLESPFLVGFENFRGAGSRTYMSGDTFWEKNLYRHPKRQGEYPEEEYEMQHDIYSLGVCLLEIGLGTSFLRFEASSQWYVGYSCRVHSFQSTTSEH